MDSTTAQCYNVSLLKRRAQRARKQTATALPLQHKVGAHHNENLEGAQTGTLDGLDGRP